MITLAFVALVINLLPFKKLQRLPLALISIVVCTVLEWGVIRTKFGTILVQDVADLSSGFPSIIFFRKSSFVQADGKARTVLPPLDSVKTWTEILPLAFFLAMIGITESLMTLQAIDAELCGATDEKTICSTKKGFSSAVKLMFLNNPREPASAQTEVIAQGVGNILSGLFGSMGGCAMIGQSMINVHNGGDKRLSSVVAGIFTLLVILSLSPVIGIVPLGSLVGLMVCVSYHTFEFSSLGWMFNSIFGGGRTFFGMIKSDGCISKFFYGGEEERTSESEKNAAELVHFDRVDDGKPSWSEGKTGEEAVKRGWKAKDEEMGADASEVCPLTNGACKSGSKQLYKIDSSPQRSPKSIVSEAPNEIHEATEEQKLSDLNIMDTLVIVLTITLTIETNLAIAVLAGAFASNLERYIRYRYHGKGVCDETGIINTTTTMEEKDILEEKVDR